MFVGSVFPHQRTVSMEVISLKNANSNTNHSLGKSWATTGDLHDYQNQSTIYNDEKMKKKIKFSPSVRVVLIPTAIEYEEANICDLIWWKDADYRLFKQDAVQELKSFLIERPDLNAKEAIKLLYQCKFDNEMSEAVSLIDCIASVSSDVTTTNSTDEESVSFYNDSVDSITNPSNDQSIKMYNKDINSNSSNSNSNKVIDSYDSNKEKQPSEHIHNQYKKTIFQNLLPVNKQHIQTYSPSHIVVGGNETQRYLENGVHDLTNDELFNYSRRCTWL